MKGEKTWFTMNLNHTSSNPKIISWIWSRKEKWKLKKPIILVIIIMKTGIIHYLLLRIVWFLIRVLEGFIINLLKINRIKILILIFKFKRKRNIKNLVSFKCLAWKKRRKMTMEWSMRNQRIKFWRVFRIIFKQKQMFLRKMEITINR